ncbi:MAG: phosphate--acyl-ACP acyltransferase, partial [Candidatus Omnitrophica bacterium]|nr:phosphate--acyl-ACP acyltransferase [Candidatus Omnitrophota bacterium]
MKIAIDGMGGDKAPSVIVEGAIEYTREFDHEIIIVGQED